MRRAIVAVIMLHAALVAALLPRPEHDMISATKGLIARRLGPAYVDQFVLEALPVDHISGLDIAHVDATPGQVHLRASSATAMGFGLHAYLKAAAQTQTNWEDDPLVLPPTLPALTVPLRLGRQAAYTYYENVCTFSYSQWSWSWAQWERHIDWMALNGINVPLAFTGQEKVWATTFGAFNVSASGLDGFFAGASFLAWGRMGNVQGSWVRGPLPRSFIEQQFELQTKILARMRAFGMTPALPAFAGHVPAEMVSLYPNAKFVQSPPWIGFKPPFTSVYMLDPTDPLFVEIGAAFLRHQASLLNYTAILYQTDTYNEMDPAFSARTYLAASSSAVLKSMRAVHPSAVWLMQGWLFSFSRFWTATRVRDYIAHLPQDGLIVLDLYSEVKPVWQTTDNYFGKYWIYCVLHNFGGSLGMRGDLPTIASDLVAARTASAGTLLGLGLTMEGIYQNYIVYDLALQMPWQASALDVPTYVDAFIRARYHHPTQNALDAWQRLAATVYNVSKGFGGVTKCIVSLRPRWGLLQSRFMPTALAHNAEDVLFAWRRLLAAAPALASHLSFTRDLVDVTRQVLSDGLAADVAALETLFHAQVAPLAELDAVMRRMQDAMEMLERILNTNRHFMLGPWLADARALGGADDAAYFEYEAKNQVTRWGDANGNALSDYASKDWGGLVSSYYLPRWRIWWRHVRSAYVARSAVDHAAVHAALEAFELAWQLERLELPVEPVEDSVSVALAIAKTLLPDDDVGAAVVKDAAPSFARDQVLARACLLDCLW
ncbi:hypothetical protein SDRG_02871 [Saprolegnia diclina VS20]|uniref:Alpha-N-acetylglucosaminidase n=1 Tax=Saprolegnia diclina (strain VS20) TaxID=1156394 RepID=T0S522_SAPDV|nr:hypothetical protein SDRG_02871 [Saprolegnia diclina VS20]EQC40223.1 hypothetical protein SDRG_02871 [Saprolegnia diclina VS20]|eukprot:XP_008606697.1 hypothetical protein SDRG_02871 [Saprolegnia diclina VS20]